MAPLISGQELLDFDDSTLYLDHYCFRLKSMAQNHRRYYLLFAGSLKVHPILHYIPLDVRPLFYHISALPNTHPLTA